METKNDKKSGVYLSNFVVTGFAFFMLVLAFATGFFAKAYFSKTAPSAASGTKADTTAQPKQAAVTLTQVKDAFGKSVVKFGDTNKKVVVVEISDPSCPYCAVAAGKNGALNTQISPNFTLVADGGTYKAPVEEIRKLVDAGEVSYAYVYYPGHGNGELAMKALYCAYDSGKFWQAHDLLMSAAGYDLINNTVKNDKTKTQVLAGFLASAIDANTLKSCLDSGKYDARLQEDTALAGTLAVSGTPGFFVNDKVFAGAYNFTDMQPTFDSFLK